MRKIITNISILFSVILITSNVFGQFDGLLGNNDAEHDPISWESSSKKLSENEYELTFTATFESGWHIYALERTDPLIPTEIVLDDSDSYEANGPAFSESKLKKAFDEAFGVNYGYFEDGAIIKQKVFINAKQTTVTGFVQYQACNDQECKPPKQYEFKFDLTGIPKSKGVKINIIPNETENTSSDNDKKSTETKGAAAVQTDKNTPPPTNVIAPTPASTNTVEKNITNNNEDLSYLYEPVDVKKETEGKSFWLIFILGFLGGLAALFMPCVFPMIPMTVSFFMKSSGKKSGVRKAVLYGLSIIILYVGIGLLLTSIFGEDVLNRMAGSPWLNLGFFFLLVIFAISFFGAFEINLPSSWANYFDKKSNETTGFVSLFFMAFTLVIVSFSCTGPLIGGLIFEAVSQGSYLGPAAGMLGFSIALALPFTLFAMFPSWLQSMPKSGGWLNTVKVSIGFIELAFSLKFLSTADLAEHWGILPRETFVSVLIAIAVFFSLYMLGKIKFPHDSDVKSVSISRFFVAMTSFAFAIYLLPGLWGAPLKAISAFAPSLQYQDFDLHTPTLQAKAAKAQFDKKSKTLVIPEKRKHSDILHAPYGIKAFFDYEEGMLYAQQANKPVFIDFTGHSCSNCRQMEAAVWPEPNALRMLNNDYVVIALYTDDQTVLPKEEQKTVEVNGKKKRIRTIMDKSTYLQSLKFKTTSLPSYFLLDTDGSLLVNHSFGFERDAPKFVNFLKEGLDNFKNKQ